MTETQRAEGNVRFQPTAPLARRMMTMMVSSTLRILTGSVPRMGADAKKALALVKAFQRPGPLMAPARGAVEDQAKVSADAEADDSR